MGAVGSSASSVRRSSLAASLLFAANCAAACQTSGGAGPIAAAFWFEGLTPAAIDVIDQRLGTPLTGDELRAIESAARRELDIAFEHTRLRFTSTRDYVYRVRVVPNVAHGFYPAAGQSRTFGGVRGDGTVSFNIVALGAFAHAGPTSTRDMLVDAIGRGIGRTAVHEFAHQILGPAAMHGEDRLSYEYEDLRAEHFYAQLHWGPAGVELQRRIGLVQE